MSVFSRVATLTGRSLFRTAVKPSVYLSVVKPRYITRAASSQSEIKHELVEALDNEIKAEQNLESDNLGGANRPTIPGENNFTCLNSYSYFKMTKFKLCFKTCQ